MSLKSKRIFCLRLLTTDTADIASTVQPDKKLSASTGIILSASVTGFMITPPPIPVIAPVTDDAKHIINNNFSIL